MGRRKIRICRIVTTLIAGVLPLLPQPVGAQKNIKVALALSRDVPGIDFINGMYEVFKSDVEARTTSALTVEILYGGVLGNRTLIDGATPLRGWCPRSDEPRRKIRAGTRGELTTGLDRGSMSASLRKRPKCCVAAN
jgi:hypothetical protein